MSIKTFKHKENKMTTIAQTANVLIQGIEIGQEIYQTVLNAMDAAEQEKDSVFYYIYDIVTNPVYTEQFATCYVGHISIGFSTGSATQLCKYNSVGNWTTISLSTEKLYNLLRRKTKISKY